ncbi:hypothetical protein V5O48_008804, partial [Marasmius crinis-equi]
MVASTDLRAMSQADPSSSTAHSAREGSLSRHSSNLFYASSSRSSKDDTDSPNYSPPRIDSPDPDAITLPMLPSSSAPRASTFISSPLNPSAMPDSPYHRAFNTVGRRSHIARLPSEEARALGNSSPSSRNSMILYHLIDADLRSDTPLPSPPKIQSKRDSTASTASGDSIVSLSSDSKYPKGSVRGPERGLVAYAYDPELDDEDIDDDWEYDAIAGKHRERLPKRAIINLGGLLILFIIAMGLFLVLPIAAHGDDRKNWLISHNPSINSTGQAQGVFDVTPGGNGGGGGNTNG